MRKYYNSASKSQKMLCWQYKSNRAKLQFIIKQPKKVTLHNRINIRFGTNLFDKRKHQLTDYNHIKPLHLQIVIS